MKVSKDNLEILDAIDGSILVEGRVQPFVRLIDVHRIHEMGPKEYRHLTFRSIIPV